MKKGSRWRAHLGKEESSGNSREEQLVVSSVDIFMMVLTISASFCQCRLSVQLVHLRIEMVGLCYSVLFAVDRRPVEAELNPRGSIDAKSR